MMKRLIPFMTVVLMLVGCGNATDDEVKTNSAEDVAEVAAVEEEASYFVDDLQTTFTVTPTKVPEITTEQEQIVREIDVHVNEVTSKPQYDDEGEKVYYSDRELVEQVAGDYPEYTAEELFDIRNDFYANIHFKDFGEYYVGIEASNRLYDEALVNNLSATEVKLDEGNTKYKEAYSKEWNTGNLYLDGQLVDFTYVLKYNNDYTEATLVQLVVGGEEADLN